MEATRAGRWRIVAHSEPGLVRRRNEDAWRVLPDARLGSEHVLAVAVFDGLGGVPHGDRASAVAADGLAGALAAAAAPAAVLPLLDDAVRATGGCTTAVVAVFPGAGDAGHVLAAGDSAAYLRRAGAAGLVAAKDSDGPNVVTDLLGGRGVRGHVVPIRLQAGDTLLLCTDGVDGVVTERSLQRVLAPDAALEVAVTRLFNDVRAAGAPDNATVVAARYG
jgi:serine/threonine protein phosphatase PrpC